MKLLKVKSVTEVLSIINQYFQPIDRTELVSLEDYGGRVLAEDISSPEVLPPFSRSSVDGYGVNACDTYGASEGMPAFVELVGEVRMGEDAEQILPGQARYVPTGGMLPPGADGVVMIEFTEVLANQVMIYRQIGPGENVINIGDDVGLGEKILSSGTPLREFQIGVLAALGITDVKVYKKPRVGILSTGNELVSPYIKNLQKAQIRDINSFTLAVMARKFGAEVVLGGIVTDKFEDILQASAKLLTEVDILVLSGGSSVGALDFTAQVLQTLGQRDLLVEGISVKPGKPTLFTKVDNKAIWGLPGHPVSAMMIFNYFGQQLINIMAGNQEKIIKPTCSAILTRNIPGGAGRTDWVRIKLLGDSPNLEAVPVFGKSGLITTLSDSHGYVELPPHKEGLEVGSKIEVILWS